MSLQNETFSPVDNPAPAYNESGLASEEDAAVLGEMM